MEPLGKIFALYKDKEKVLLHYLPPKTVSEVRGYRYRDGGDTDDLVYLGELTTLVSKMTGVSIKGKVIRNTDGHLTLRKGKINRRFPISDYYVFVKPKVQKSASDKRAFIEALLQSL